MKKMPKKKSHSKSTDSVVASIPLLMQLTPGKALTEEQIRELKEQLASAIAKDREAQER